MTKKNNKKWIPPQKRMKKYKDFGVTNKKPSVEKVKWTEFIIIVPSTADKKEVQAAMEYFHDMQETDTDFVTVNQFVHEYEHGDESDKHSRLLVDDDMFRQLKQRICPHTETYIDSGIKYCKLCGLPLLVTSYRD